ncbi:MAG: energy-coupling factor ABC transporter ATP-binding protein [Oscillospiraceae bacterium]|nr:energy-coupling factor ABC transporter ATP-binding protein [Oscillospiraceae bacterium]
MLKLQDVTVIYPDKTKAVDSLSFDLGAGENIALIGENGAGKTSLLLAIVGILETSGGFIEVNGLPLNKKNLNEIRKQVGFVFQNPDDQLFMPQIYDDVAFGCRNIGVPENEIQKRVDETLGLLGIDYLRKRSSLKLSGGEKRMAAIATVLAMDPSVLIFDEPTAYLDPKAKRALAETLKNLKHPKIIATHDMAFAAEVCDRLIVLKNGRIMANGELSLLGDDEFMRSCGL